jgi:stage V sporulation protein AC
LLDCVKAYVVGGLICVLGEALFTLYSSFIEKQNDSRLLVSVTLIFLSCFLSGIGIFDKIAKHAGAGTLVPITGFANAVVSPAIDNKAEGFILGVGAKMFTIAGPVIVYGTVASVIYGVIYWITTLF